MQSSCLSMQLRSEIKCPCFPHLYSQCFIISFSTSAKSAASVTLSILGYDGVDCSLRKGTPPSNVRYLEQQFCDMAERPCRSIRLQADNIVITNNVTCRFMIKVCLMELLLNNLFRLIQRHEEIAI